MPEVELLAMGEGEYRLHDTDAIRARTRDRKRRELVDKTTSKALFGFDDSTRGLTLLGVLDGLDVDEVIADMVVKPRVAARGEPLAPPGARETEILRDRSDPGRTVIGRAAKSR